MYTLELLEMEWRISIWYLSRQKVCAISEYDDIKEHDIVLCDGDGSTIGFLPFFLCTHLYEVAMWLYRTWTKKSPLNFHCSGNDLLWL